MLAAAWVSAGGGVGMGGAGQFGCIGLGAFFGKTVSQSTCAVLPMKNASVSTTPTVTASPVIPLKKKL